ncbi:MAG TPA: tRNA adenosine(34) deaminase TadA [Ignavibacteriaceae bacterium]|nr:tRNA adenosine(34) deaminase TadA [Ignavibacteriaceae bacterium]
MLFAEENYKFMFAALQEAERALENNEVPVGAVVVHQNKIIGKGYNQVELLKDATAHAEILAITSAANHLQDWRLNECDIYVTLEPCVMCAGAILLSRIKNLYFSIFDFKFGACGSVYNIPEEGKYNHKTNVYSGIYAEESKSLLQSFFGKVRFH